MLATAAGDRGESTAPSMTSQVTWLTACAAMRWLMPGWLAVVNSTKCLEIGFGGTADFNNVNQCTCHGGSLQQWTLVNV